MAQIDEDEVRAVPPSPFSPRLGTAGNLVGIESVHRIAGKDLQNVKSLPLHDRIRARPMINKTQFDTFIGS